MQYKDIQQLCYAHDGGWDVVYDSIEDDIIRENCYTLLSDNSQLSVLDKNKNISNELKNHRYGIYIDNYAIYLYGVCYGLKENSIPKETARPISFSHAYVFPWGEDEYLYNPSRFLLFNEDDFKNTKEDVIAQQEKSISAPEYIFNEIIEKYKIDQDGFINISKKVFLKIYELLKSGYSNTTTPLYIQTDGTLKEMYDLVYCIFICFPQIMKQSFSSVSTSGGSTVIRQSLIRFVTGDNSASVIIPSNASHIVFSEKEKAILEEYSFFEENIKAAFTTNSFDKQINELYKHIDGKVFEGFKRTELSIEKWNMVYKLVLTQGIKGSEKASPKEELFDLLDTHSHDNVIEDKIINLINDEFINKKQIIANPELEDKLGDYVSKSENEKLTKTYDLYLTNKILEDTNGSPLSKFCDLNEENQLRMARQMFFDLQDINLIDEFFSKKYENMDSWESVSRFFDDFIGFVLKIHDINKDIRDSIIVNFVKNNDINECKRILSDSVSPEKNKSVSEYIFSINTRWNQITTNLLNCIEACYRNSVQKDNASSEFENYKKFLYVIFGSGNTSERTEKERNARKYFWEHKRICDISRFEKYDNLYDDSEKCKIITRLLEIIKQDNRQLESYNIIIRFFNENKTYFDTNISEKNDAIKFLQNNSASFLGPNNDENFKKNWIKSAALVQNEKNQNIFIQLLANSLEICNLPLNSPNMDECLLRFRGGLINFYDGVYQVEENEKEILHCISASLIKHIEDLENSGIHIILDIWFYLGLYTNDKNPLCLLEKDKPYYLNKCKISDIENCDFLNKSTYNMYLNSYLKKNGPLSKEVKKLINLRKKAYKKIKNKNKKNLNKNSNNYSNNYGNLSNNYSSQSGYSQPQDNISNNIVNNGNIYQPTGNSNNGELNVAESNFQREMPNTETSGDNINTNTNFNRNEHNANNNETNGKNNFINRAKLFIQNTNPLRVIFKKKGRD